MVKYEVWIKGRKAETKKEIDVAAYADGSNPTPMKVAGAACSTDHFAWSDYKNLRFNKL